MINFYETLGIGTSLTLPEIQEKLRSMEQVWASRVTTSEQAAEKLDQIAQAKQVFASEESRAVYDRELAGPQQPDVRAERQRKWQHWFDEAKRYMATGKPDLAKAAIDKSMAFADEEYVSAEYYLMVAKIYHANHITQSVVQENINKAIILEPENPWLYIEKGDLLGQTREYQEAANIAKASGEVHAFARADARLAQYYLSSGVYKIAKQYVDAALQVEIPPSDYLRDVSEKVQARIAEEARRRAEEEEARKKRRRDWEHWYSEAKRHLVLGEFDAAVDAVEKAESCAPKGYVNAEYYQTIARVYFSRNRHDREAHIYIDKAISMDPNNPWLYINKGDFLGSPGDYELAVEKAKAAGDSHALARAYACLANYYLNHNYLKAAERCVDAALQVENPPSEYLRDISDQVQARIDEEERRRAEEERQSDEEVQTLTAIRDSMRRRCILLFLNPPVIALANLGQEFRYSFITSQKELEDGMRVNANILNIPRTIGFIKYDPTTGMDIYTTGQTYRIDYQTSAILSPKIRLPVLARPVDPWKDFDGFFGSWTRSDGGMIECSSLTRKYSAKGLRLDNGKLILEAYDSISPFIGSKSYTMPVPGGSRSHGRRFTFAAMSYTHVVGLVSDGTVVASPYYPFDEFREDDYGQFDVSGWSNIIKVGAASYATFGLRDDGTILYTGKQSDWAKTLTSWCDVIDFIINDEFAVALTVDGRILSSGVTSDFSKWSGIVAIKKSQERRDNSFAGLRKDGVVLVWSRNQTFNVPLATDFDFTK